MSESTDWEDATGFDPARDMSTQLHPNLGKTTAEQKTCNASHATVEVVEELSPEEEADRIRLELLVERAFYQAGCSLRELRDRRLYRDTHPDNFIGYCRDRFDKTKQAVNYLIAAAGVYENLLQQTTTNCCRHSPQVLPTNESQVRSLAGLEPDEQCQIWSEAVKVVGGKVPSARSVKNVLLRHQGIVSRLKQRDTAPPPIPFTEGDVMLIRGLGDPELKKYDGQWTLALAINEFCVTIALNGKDIPVKPQFLEPVEPKYWAEIKAVNQRITRLQQSCDLDPMDDAGLEVLRRRTCFTQRQIMLLERMENDYGVV